MKIIFIIILFFNIDILNSQTCEWAKSISGAIHENLNAMDVDVNSNIYVCGNFNSSVSNFGNSISLTHTDGGDCFIAKYDSYGDCLWATRIASNNSDAIYDLILSDDDNIYVSGSFSGNELNFNNGINLTNSNGTLEGFVAKYDLDGNCIWARLISGSLGDGSDLPLDVDVDSNNDIIIVGTNTSKNMVFGNGIILTNDYIPYTNIFVSKFNNSGICQWAFKIEGKLEEYAPKIKILADNSFLISGSFSSDTIKVENLVVLTKPYSPIYAFVAYFDENANYQSIFDIKSSLVGINDIDYDSDGNLLIFGIYASSQVNFNNGINLTAPNNQDGFLASYTNGLCQWAVQIKGFGIQTSADLFIDDDSDILISGSFSSPDLYFNNNISIANYSFFYTDDAYFASFNKNGKCLFAENIGELNFDKGFAIKSKNNKLYTAGVFTSNPARFNNEITLNLVGGTDGFLAKYYYNKIREQAIIMNAGWNWISGYIKPINDSLEVILNDLSSNLLILKNFDGDVYIPLFNINTIGNWNYLQAYKAYMTSADTLILKGEKVTPSQEILRLSNGWRLIPYLPSTEKSPVDCMLSLTTDNSLLILKNLGGQVYIPSFGINTIGSLKPGVGYQVYLNNLDELVYPD